MAAPGYYSRRMAGLRAGRGNCCEQCGSTSDLEWAHLWPTGLKGRGRGLSQRVHDITNNPSAYRLLCRVHHALLDGREI